MSFLVQIKISWCAYTARKKIQKRNSTPIQIEFCVMGDYSAFTSRVQMLAILRWLYYKRLWLEICVVVRWKTRANV